MSSTQQDTPTQAKPVYAFPKESVCKSETCDSTDTYAYKTKDRIQYRRCRKCGYRYNEVGKAVYF